MTLCNVRGYLVLLLASIFFCVFLLFGSMRTAGGGSVADGSARVVIDAPLLVLLNFGDRFLAANIESVRISTIGMDLGVANIDYLRRSQLVVSELNACHENNYYLANALLTWGGAVGEGELVLQRASECRRWDEWPAFFYGFNRYFFMHDASSAIDSINRAADRSRSNAAGFRKLAIMMRAETISEERLALDFLRQQAIDASDEKLKAMLQKRILRLERLIELRDAQRVYESRYERLLGSPGELLQKGIIEAFPVDPLGLGYEFVDGRFRMKSLSVPGFKGWSR